MELGSVACSAATSTLTSVYLRPDGNLVELVNWAGLGNSYFWIVHASGIAATLMTQVLPFFEDGVVQTLLGFEAAVYAA